MSLFSLTAQFSVRNTADFRLSLSCCSSLQSHYAVCCLFSAFAAAHWAVWDFVFVQIWFNITVCCCHCCKIWSYINFVIAPFAVWSHSLCHFVTPRSLSYVTKPHLLCSNKLYVSTQFGDHQAASRHSMQKGAVSFLAVISPLCIFYNKLI